MKSFHIDPTQEQEVIFSDSYDFIKYCTNKRYAILGIEVGVFSDDKLPTSILDNSKATGDTFDEYLANCNKGAEIFINNHQNYANHIFIFVLLTEQRYLEYIRSKNN